MRKISKEDYQHLQELEKERRLSTAAIAEELGISQRYAEVFRTLLDNPDTLNEIFVDDDILNFNRKQAKTIQNLRDTNRIERKGVREHLKMENALEGLNQAVIDEFEKLDFKVDKLVEEVTFIEGDQAIVQLSDTHFNELVDLPDNTYDFEVAGKRMALFAREAKRFFSLWC